MTKFDSSVTNVVVVGQIDEDVFAEVEAMYKDTFGIFAKQKGYLGGTILKSEESCTLVSVLQWESKEDHIACTQSPDWWQTPKAGRWKELMEAGKIRMQPEVYSVLCQ